MTNAAHSFPDDWPESWRTAENLAAHEALRVETRRAFAPIIDLLEAARRDAQRNIAALPVHVREGKYMPKDLFTPEQYKELQARGSPYEMIEYIGALRLAHNGLHRNTTDRIRTAWKQYEAVNLAIQTGKTGSALIAEILARFDKGNSTWRRLIGERGKNPAWAISKWLPRVEIKELIEESPALNVLMPLAQTVARNFYDPRVFVEARGEHESKADFESRVRGDSVKISHEALADELADWLDDDLIENPFEEEDPDFLVNLEAAREVIGDTSAENILGIIRAIPIGKLLSGE